jgi:hypothetical protein
MTFSIDPSGEWKPVATSDSGEEWGGSESWVRARSEVFARSIWLMKRWNRGTVLEITWSGITDAEKEENELWSEEFAKKKA